MKKVIHTESGSALLIAVGTLSVAMMLGALALTAANNRAINVRTGGAQIEANAYFQSLQQALSSQQACTQTLTNLQTKTLSFTIAQENGQQVPYPSSSTLPFTSNRLAIGAGSSQTTLFGTNSSGQNTLSNLVSSSKVYIDLTKNFRPFGLQNSGTVAGNNCYSATLHADVDLETQTNPLLAVQQTSSTTTSSSIARRTIGSQFVGQDFPLVVTTDQNNNVNGCFVGNASGYCTPPDAPLITVQPDTHCHDPYSYKNFTINFSVTNGASATVTCTSSSSGPQGASYNSNLTSNQPFSGTIDAGFKGCVITASNSVGDSVSVSDMLNFVPDCSVAAITLTPPSQCVNVGSPINLTWADTNSDENPNDIVSITMNSSPAQTKTPTLSAGETGSVSFDSTSSGPGSFTVSASDNDWKGSNTASATVQVDAVPQINSFTPNPPKLNADQLPASVQLNWSTTGATSINVSGTGSGLPVTSTNQSSSANSGPIPVGATSATWTLNASGGCPGTPNATSTISFAITPCTCSFTAATDECTPGNKFYDSCGTLPQNQNCACATCNKAAGCVSQSGGWFYPDSYGNTQNPNCVCPPVAGLCNPATDNQDFASLSAGNANLCSDPTMPVTGFTTTANGWAWTCNGLYGGSTEGCTANLIVNGACGPASGTPSTSAPTAGLCNSGTATTPTKVGTNWNWNCQGANTGSTPSCSAVGSCPLVANTATANIGVCNLGGIGGGPCGGDSNSAGETWERTGVNSSAQIRTEGGAGNCPYGALMPPLVCPAYLSVPSNATIQGVAVTACLSSNAGNEAALQSISLLSGGTTLAKKTLNQTFYSSGCSAPLPSYGGSADTWGATLTPAQINSISIDYQFVDNQDRIFFYDGNNGNTVGISGITVWYGVPNTPAPACGSAVNTYTTTPPTSNLCVDGSTPSVSGSSPSFSWTCPANCAGGAITCNTPPTSPKPSCGSAAGVTSSTKPTTNLCSAGSSAPPGLPVSGGGQWIWQCVTSTGQTSPECFAPDTAPACAPPGTVLANAYSATLSCPSSAPPGENGQNCGVIQSDANAVCCSNHATATGAYLCNPVESATGCGCCGRQWICQ